MLLSDARATLFWPDGRCIHVDNVQKLIPIPPHAVIGFTGDVATASFLLQVVIRQLRARSRPREFHPVSLHRWLPRVLRAAWLRHAQRLVHPTSFMVGSVLLGRKNLVARDRVWTLVEQALRENKRTWIPDIAGQIIQLPPEVSHVLVGTVENLVYVLRSPEFIPEHIRPLHSAVIGSGSSAAASLDASADALFLLQPGNSFVESHSFRGAVEFHLERHPEPTVGGGFPCVKITASGIEPCGFTSEMPVGGDVVSILPQPGLHWLQENRTTGKRIRLEMPWNIDFRKYRSSVTFDDFFDARRRWRHPEA